MSDSVPWNDLDPGIRDVVRLLHDNGFDTCDSGDGKSKFNTEGEPLLGTCDCAMPFPHVVANCSGALLVAECHRLKDLLRTRGVVVEAQGPDGDSTSIQASYDPVSEVGVILLLDLDDARLAAVGRLSP